MTPQEQQLLASLCQRVNQTQLPEKDEDAENLLGHELGSNPDAVYILAQTVLVQDIALQQARAQVTQLQQQLQQTHQQPAHSTSFLGRLLGEREPAQQPPPQPAPAQMQQQAPPFQPVPGYQPAPAYQSAPPQYGAPQFMAVPGGQPSFLRGAMQTAAGVAAGALAFEGVESILHGFGHGGYGYGPGIGGFGMGPGMGMGGGFGRPVEETVVNNYYDTPDAEGHAGQMGAGEPRFEPGGNEPHFHESADPAGNQGFQDQSFENQSGAQFTDASDNAGANETAGDYGQGNFDPGMDNASVAADNSLDDVQIDDSGSGLDDGSGGGFDDGSGGFDSSGGDGF